MSDEIFDQIRGVELTSPETFLARLKALGVDLTPYDEAVFKQQEHAARRARIRLVASNEDPAGRVKV
jgi:hypothetical protein